MKVINLKALPRLLWSIKAVWAKGLHRKCALLVCQYQKLEYVVAWVKRSATHEYSRDRGSRNLDTTLHTVRILTLH